MYPITETILKVSIKKFKYLLIMTRGSYKTRGIFFKAVLLELCTFLQTSANTACGALLLSVIPF
jgi:hypothetical protein